MTMCDHSRRVPTDASGTPILTATLGPHGTSGSVRVWTCTDCGAEGVWSKRWAYFGTLECPGCERTTIERVSCGCKKVAVAQ